MPYDPLRHGPRRIAGPGFNERVYAAVLRIPEGFVSTYGDVAAALGRRRLARQVGFALSALPPDRDEVPWHRVVGSGGVLSRRGDAGPDPEQHRRLKEEGHRISESGRIGGFAEVRFEPPPADVDCPASDEAGLVEHHRDHQQ